MIKGIICKPTINFKLETMTHLWAYFRGDEGAIVPPEIVFKEFIICEMYITNFF
jgi:hypothetical protein